LGKIIQFEEGGGPFTRCWREDRCIDEVVASIVEEISHCAYKRRPHAHDGLLPAATKPEVSVVHQEGYAMFFLGDGVGLGDVIDLQRVHAHFDAKRRAIVRAYGAYNLHGGFLGQRAGRLEIFFGNIILAGHDLNGAGTVANFDEVNLSRRPAVTHPSAKGYGFAHVF